MDITDILYNILQWLPLDDLKIVQYVNKKWYLVLQDDHFWKRKMYLDYNSRLQLFHSNLSWKYKYRQFTKVCNLLQESKDIFHNMLK